MKNIPYHIIVFILLISTACAQVDKVALQYDNGISLTVNAEKLMINGMNWDCMPIGTNYEYNLWGQPEELIKRALDHEMGLLKDMGVNAIRVYVGIPPKWIQYIYENYGIYTMLNHSFGRYGLSIDGNWVPTTIYGNPKSREVLLRETTDLAKEYKDTPGLLFYLLGNENNYGLFWEGAETEDIPMDEDQSATRARDMYKLFNEAVLAMKEIDKNHPVAICNGDLMFLDIIKEECKDIDIFGTNVYRGASFGDVFKKVKKELNKPVIFTEFGSDAYNVVKGEEDQKMQAHYLKENWEEIYKNASGLGLAENAIGGFTFQFSDGWWKYGQTKNLEQHDTTASWANGAYKEDFEKGTNNMNEEWFGICAKGQTDEHGNYQLTPRIAYYVLMQAHKLNPYSDSTTLKSIGKYFSKIPISEKKQ